MQAANEVSAIGSLNADPAINTVDCLCTCCKNKPHFLFLLVQTKVVEKFFGNPQMTAANARLINDTLQHSMQFARVRLLFFTL